MVVLKKGDCIETFRLDADRRFAQSFMDAWNMICSHYRDFLSFSCLPSAVAGLIACVWLTIKSYNVFLPVDPVEYVLDAVTGVMLLFLCSFIRSRQLLFLNNEDAMESANGFLKRYKQCFRNTVKAYAPMLIAWIVFFTLFYLMIGFKVVAYISLPCIILLLIIIFPFFGLVQSYMEDSNAKVHKSFLKGIKLNGRYFGGFCVLFVISTGILFFVSVVLSFGEFILLFLYKNQSNGLFLGEDVSLPWFVGLLKYFFMFVSVFFITLFQCLWSLPQQIHVKSILFKYNTRKNKTEETVEKYSTTSL